MTVTLDQTLKELVATAGDLAAAPDDAAAVDEIITRLAMFARLAMNKAAEGEAVEPQLAGLTARLRSLTDYLERAVLAYPAADGAALQAAGVEMVLIAELTGIRLGGRVAPTATEGSVFQWREPTKRIH
jgi:hypothetical protein